VQGVPPYIVFGDASLMQMARDKPVEEEEFLAITGVGQHKLAKYGDDFLAAIAHFCMEQGQQAGVAKPAV
jgi:ATP-dependent DNA helicase RecQ